MPMRQSVDRPPMRFPFLRQPLQATFDADQISSNGGVLLLRTLDDRLGLSAGLACCFPDPRRAQQVIHPRREQIRQRLFQMALGYPDCNDADTLRQDPLLKAACGREPNDPRGLSSQATLTRLEQCATPALVRKLVRHLEDDYIAALPADTTILILDVDTTEDPAHGQQEFVGFNAHYDSHMYLHLLLFDEQGQLITALLRPGRAKASQGVAGLLHRLVRKLKRRFPHLQIVLRGDSAFATPQVLSAVEDLHAQYGAVDYLLGYAKNSRLEQHLAPLLEQAHQRRLAGSPVVLFTQFSYQTTQSWPHPRLVIGKAESTALGPNPRFLVTSIEGFDPGLLYRQGYCARGQAENAIKDFKNALHSDRLSCHSYWANFLRLLLFVAAYRLLFALRHHALEAALPTGAAHEGKALVAPSAQSLQLDTLRSKLLKVAAQVKQTARRLVVRLCASFAYQDLFTRIAARLLTAQAVPTG